MSKSKTTKQQNNITKLGIILNIKANTEKIQQNTKTTKTTKQQNTEQRTKQ